LTGKKIFESGTVGGRVFGSRMAGEFLDPEWREAPARVTFSCPWRISRYTNPVGRWMRECKQKVPYFDLVD
jgi:hypothetical protein